jgi:hypothetical protein
VFLPIPRLEHKEAVKLLIIVRGSGDELEVDMGPRQCRAPGARDGQAVLTVKEQPQALAVILAEPR